MNKDAAVVDGDLLVCRARLVLTVKMAQMALTDHLVATDTMLYTNRHQ